MTRKPLALYCFTNGRPQEEVSGQHSTLFRERSRGDFRPTITQRVRRLASGLVPPIISRQLRR